MNAKVTLQDYKVLFDSAPDAIFITNAEGDFLLVNQQFCDVTGYSKSELQGMHVLDTYLSSESDLYKTRLVQLTTDKEAVLQRFVRHKDGSVFYAQIRANKLSNGWIRGIIHDKGFENDLVNTLAEKEQLFIQIADNIREIFFLVDSKTGEYLYVSPSYETIYQKPVRELMVEPTSWMDTIHPEDKKKMKALYQEQLQTGIFDATYRILRSDKSIRWVRSRTFPVYNKNREIYRIAGITEDITDFVQAKQDRLEYSENLKRSFHEMIIAMSAALEQRDSYTSGHQNNVTQLSLAIAKEIGLPETELDCLEIAAQVHDIGKIGIPLEILTRSRKLTEIEYALIRTHPEAGYDILKNIHFPWPIAEIILQHHERINGSGYPRGLSGDQILIEAKIIAVADTIDAMSSHRPYRASLGIKAALAEIEKYSGILYDPLVVKACLKIFADKKITMYS